VILIHDGSHSDVVNFLANDNANAIQMTLYGDASNDVM
jgi:hypothetical protein